MKRLCLLFLCAISAGAAVGPRRLWPLPLPVAHYRLEGANLGSVWMDSMGTNHLSNTHTSGTRPATNTGKMFLSAAFATNSLSFLASSSTNLNGLQNTNFCVAVWFNPTNIQDYRQVIARRGSTGAEWAMDVYKNNGAMSLRWLGYDTGWKVLAVTNPIIYANTWNLFVGYRDGTNWGARLFTPSQPSEITTGMVLTTTFNNWSPLAIGNSAGGSASSCFCGLIDSVTIWKEMLTSGQMIGIWNLGHGGLDFYTQ